MISHFDKPTNRARLMMAVDRWFHTPFAPWQCVCGAGVDCVQLAGALMVETGVLSEQPNFGNYTLDLAGHTGREMITEWLEDSPRFLRLGDWLLLYNNRQPAPPKAGDIVTFRIGKAVNHVGVMVSARDFVHSIQGRAVRVSTLDDSTWSGRVAAFWRAL